MTEPAATQDAYALLSKPTLQLSDEEVTIIIADLRKKRIASLTTGKPDKTVAEAKKAKAQKALPKSQQERAALTADLLASIKIPGLD